MTDPKRLFRKARCRACGGKIGRVINLFMLDRKATWKYPTAGNVLTGESGRAMAILCDQCLDTGAVIREALEFKDSKPVYHPVGDLEEMPPEVPA